MLVNSFRICVNTQQDCLLFIHTVKSSSWINLSQPAAFLESFINFKSKTRLPTEMEGGCKLNSSNQISLFVPIQKQNPVFNCLTTSTHKPTVCHCTYWSLLFKLIKKQLVTTGLGSSTCDLQCNNSTYMIYIIFKYI